MKYSRRSFLITAAGACGAAVAGDAFAFEPAKVLVTRHEVRVPGLASAFDGMRVAHVTDVHFPGSRGAARVTLEHLKREKPEIVVMTGDMTEHVKALSLVAAFAREARGSLATVATLGNWEYQAGAASQVAAVYRSVGVQLLVNAHRDIRVGGSSLVLVGLDDPVAGRPDPLVARAGLPSGGSEIWLVHAPGFASLPPQVSAVPAFILSGHTHGGQIRLPFLPAVTPYGSGRFVAGWYRDTFAPLYVSRGIGTTMIRARFDCPPELPIFTLRRA
jgi:uncharacterized protein